MSDEEPLWLGSEDNEFFHGTVIAEFGGSDGVRDKELLESAVVRAQNHFAHGSKDIFDRAAVYAHSIAKNHPFVDGNKRAAFTAACVFMEINGLVLVAAEEEAVVMVESLAASKGNEAIFASWLRKNSRAL